jgi:protein TonB
MNLHPDISSNTLFVVIAAMVFVLTALTLLLRRSVKLAEKKDLTAKYKDKVWKSPMEARAKYPDVDIFKYRSYGLLLGLVCALLLTVVFMNWTLLKGDDTLSTESVFIEADIEIAPPQTSDPPPPPPPPPPPSVIEVPEELVTEMEDNVEFMDQSIEAESVIDVPPPPEPKPGPVTIAPPPPPPPKEQIEEIFKVVEEMPRFPGCEDLKGTTAEKKLCAERALYHFIEEHLEYPPTARENNIQGNVVVQFVVNKDGTIQDAKVLRDIGAGCGEEVLRVVALMNQQNLRWTAGKQRGVPVRVIFILPVKFTLVSS